MISGVVYALDIDPEFVSTVKRKAKKLELDNVEALVRDFISEGSGLGDSSVDLCFSLQHSAC